MTNKLVLLLLLASATSSQASPVAEVQTATNPYVHFQNVRLVTNGKNTVLKGSVRKRASGPLSVIGHLDLNILDANRQTVKSEAFAYQPTRLSKERRRASDFALALNKSLPAENRLTLSFHAVPLRQHDTPNS